MDFLLVMFKLIRVCHKRSVLSLLLYMLPLEDKLKEIDIIYCFYADETVLYFVFGSTLSHCMFYDILTSIQRSFKLMLKSGKCEYMIIRKCKIGEHGLLRLSEDGDKTEQVEIVGCFIDCQLTLQRQIILVCSNSFHFPRKVWLRSIKNFSPD